MSESDGLISINDFKRAQLRTAKILEAKPHPNADKLMLLSVDVGRRPPSRSWRGFASSTSRPI